jgi:hypothetical protein
MIRKIFFNAALPHESPPGSPFFDPTPSLAGMGLYLPLNGNPFSKLFYRPNSARWK